MNESSFIVLCTIKKHTNKYLKVLESVEGRGISANDASIV